MFWFNGKLEAIWQPPGQARFTQTLYDLSTDKANDYLRDMKLRGYKLIEAIYYPSPSAWDNE